MVFEVNVGDLFDEETEELTESVKTAGLALFRQSDDKYLVCLPSFLIDVAKFDIEGHKSNLSETDWVVSKISEAQITDPQYAEELKEKYRSILEDRARWRQEVNEIQEKYNLG